MQDACDQVDTSKRCMNISSMRSMITSWTSCSKTSRKKTKSSARFTTSARR